MRNVNIFRTHVTDHIIPSEIMRRALVLSPGKDWTDQKTEAYKYLKRWALEQDKRYPDRRAMKEAYDEAMNAKDEIELTRYWEGYDIPCSIYSEAMQLSPMMSVTDKRTKAYKYLKRWALEQDNNENSK